MLRIFRAKKSMRELAEKIGADRSAIGSIENGRWSSDSKAMKDLLTCDYFSPKQQEELTQVYERMRAAEWEEEE